MATGLRVALEIGPKGKRVVAVAPDWPGLERGAKSEEDAIQRLRGKWPASGRCGTWFGIPRITRWITPGRWKTRI
jgi:hypothetical protein